MVRVDALRHPREGTSVTRSRSRHEFRIDSLSEDSLNWRNESAFRLPCLHCLHDLAKLRYRWRTELWEQRDYDDWNLCRRYDSERNGEQLPWFVQRHHPQA